MQASVKKAPWPGPAIPCQFVPLPSLNVMRGLAGVKARMTSKGQPCRSCYKIGPVGLGCYVAPRASMRILNPMIKRILTLSKSYPKTVREWPEYNVQLLINHLNSLILNKLLIFKFFKVSRIPRALEGLNANFFTVLTALEIIDLMFGIIKHKSLYEQKNKVRGKWYGRVS